MTVPEGAMPAEERQACRPPTAPPQDAAAGGAAAESVCVAVNVRPLVDTELAEGCKDCLLVTPDEPQVGHGAHLFTFDHVFSAVGGGTAPPSALYQRCVAPLVDGLFKGYNATVFAYGQTGSGKTYTMGSAFAPGAGAAGRAPQGVIPNVMEAIFARIAAAPPDTLFTVRVGFVEIHKEEIRDLLVTRGGPQPVVTIREDKAGITLAGAQDREVRSRQEMVDVLEQGTLLRATAATGMNKQSSRSHAIFTITLEQRRVLVDGGSSSGGGGGEAALREGDDSSDDEEEGEEEGGAGEGADTFLTAKMHLVDLAGSERAKRTKAVGQRLQEGININKGLLALGNVINALSEGKAHVPYRDSKLTRMLQDSLGGNSRTVMIACVSPADVNLEETLNTLRYANRARNIRNKPVVNRDPVAAMMAQMRQQLAALRSENASLKARLGLGDGAAPDFGGPSGELLRAAVDDLEAANRQLAEENKRLRVERDNARDDARDATEKMVVAQAQRARLLQRVQELSPEVAAQAREAAEALAGGTSSEGDVIRGQLERIAELECEVKRLKQVSRLSGAFAASMRRQSLAPGEAPRSPFLPSPLAQSDDEGEQGAHELCALELHDDEFVAQEQEHNLNVAKMQGELEKLQRQMEAKMAAMQSMSQHSALRQKYDERLVELQAQLGELHRERSELLQKLDALAHASEEERLRLRAQYEARIRQLDEKVKAVRAKERRAVEMERMKAKAETACKKLEQDILSIKQQKVSLIKKLETSSREFADWKKQRDRELLQLKKQGRLNAVQLQKLEALHSKQQAVLRRKTEEAEAARKRLKELEDRQQRLASRPATAATSAAERPFTAPPASGGAAGHPPRPPTSGAGAGVSSAVERSGASAHAAAGASSDMECQPNAMAPLLRDEKGRREWVECELDAHCSSYELQKVMEGERAQRSEVQRKLRDVEKALAAIRNPGWWGSTAQLVSPSSASEEKLVKRREALVAQSELHSKQFEAAQARLLEAQQAEEAKGGVPGDARRWNGVRTVVQARALLKTLFRAASQHKAQAIEAAAQVTELCDEIELLKLRLDILETEKFEAAQQVAKYQVLLEKAEEQRPDVDGAASNEAATPARQLLRVPPGGGDVASADMADEGLREAHEILQQLNMLATEGPPSALGAGGAAAAGGEEEEEEEDGSEEEDEEEWEEDEEEMSSEDEERHALWDPSCATPARGFKGRAPGGRAAPGDAASSDKAQRQRRRRRSSTTSGGAGGALLPEEQPVLAHLNEQLRQQGKEPVAKPTIALMKEALKGKVVGGQPWRLGSKKREDLIRDYRLMLGLKPDADTPPAVGAAKQQQQGQQQGAAPVSARGGGSRLLEHTASSLARCAATLQHVATSQQQHPPAAPLSGGAAAAPPAAPTSTRAFGSPLPPPHSRASSAGLERVTEGDSGSTPVGGDGETPEGAAPEVRQRDGVASPDGGSRARTLQLQSLAAELSALSEQGAVTLGLNPNRLAPSSGSGPQQAQCGESPRPAAGAADGSGSKPSSPFRRAFSLMGLGRSGSPPPSGSSPAAAAARHQQGSPRLARLLGRGGSGGLSSAAAEHTPEATYELPQEQQQRRSEKAALRSNNSAGNSEAGGSRPGSPSERNFRLGSCGVPAPPTENRSRPTSPVKQLSGGGRPRTGGSATSSAAAAPRPQPSPRRPEKVWKPL